MIKRIKKGLTLGVSLALLAKKEANKHVGKFVKGGKIHSKKVKEIINKVASEAKREGKRIGGFLVSELKREAKRVKSSIEKIKSKNKRKK